MNDATIECMTGFDETPILDALRGQSMVVTNGAIPVPQGHGLSLDRNLLAELAIA
ncbi:MAG: hypothetical protein ABGX47_01475 [Martelella sp.]|uniref:hypothetical protein n=1 Tax=Martelella sp. TaxID=1969699 RepID=UPI003242994A